MDGWIGNKGPRNGWAGDGQQDGVVNEEDVSPLQSPAHRLLGRRKQGPGPSGFPIERVQRASRALENSNRVPKLLDDEYSNMFDDKRGAIRNLNGIKHLYCDKTWGKGSFEYDLP